MVRTYDAAKVTIIVGGIPISGFPDGSFCKVTRDADAFTKVVGADGTTSRSKSNNKGGTATITLAQTSPSNDVLSALAVADELDNKGVVPFAVKDLSGRSTFVSAFAWIKKTPESEFGKDLANREWVFDLADVDILVGGNGDII